MARAAHRGKERRLRGGRRHIDRFEQAVDFAPTLIVVVEESVQRRLRTATGGGGCAIVDGHMPTAGRQAVARSRRCIQTSQPSKSAGAFDLPANSQIAAEASSSKISVHKGSRSTDTQIRRNGGCAPAENPSTC